MRPSRSRRCDIGGVYHSLKAYRHFPRLRPTLLRLVSFALRLCGPASPKTATAKQLATLMNNQRNPSLAAISVWFTTAPESRALWFRSWGRHMTAKPKVRPKETCAGPPILRVSYGLTLHLHERVVSFPKSHRYSLGQALTERALALTTALVAANTETSPHGRLQELNTASSALATLRITLRIAYDLRCFSAKEQALLLTRLEDVGRQLAGWVAYTCKQQTPC